MRVVSLLLGVMCFFCSSALYADALSLFGTYERAREHDAKLRSKRAGYEAQKEEVGKARALLRPSIDASYMRGRNLTETTQQGLLGPVTEKEYYSTRRYGIYVKQPLLDLASFVSLGKAKVLAEKSDELIQFEQHDLILRVVNAYSNALYAEDNLDFINASLEAAEGQLRQARKRYESGFGTITEIKEAEANHKRRQAELLEADAAKKSNFRKLEAIIGYYPEKLLRFDPDRMTVIFPEPLSVDEWVAMARQNNHTLKASRKDVRIADKEVAIQRYERVPTIDLVAGKSYSESADNYSIGTKYDTYSMSLQLELPIYTGGYISAAVRQATLNRLAARESADLMEREVVSAVQQYFNAVIVSKSQITAYEQAIEAAGEALKATRKAYLHGFRSNVDVLNAQEELLLSRRNLARSRYQYLLNLVYLKEAAGTLSEKDLLEFNDWLVQQ